MIQVQNLNGIQSSRQLFMRGAAGVNIVGQFINVTVGGDATLRAGVREKEKERERDAFILYTPLHVSDPCGATEARWTSNSKVVGSSPIRGDSMYFFFFLFFISSSLSLYVSMQTEIEIEGGSGGISVNTNNLPRIPGSEAAAAAGYHLCSCEDGKLFLVNTNSRGCFIAVGHSQLPNICS